MGALDPKLLRAKHLVDAKRAALEQQEAVTEKVRGRCERAFESLWQAKMDAVQRGLIPFHDAFSQLQNVSLEVGTGREDAPKIDEVTVADVGRLEPSAVESWARGPRPAWPVPPRTWGPPPRSPPSRRRLPGQRSVLVGRGGLE